ncbi:MAG: glycosyltransferase [Sedimenticola sp.]
MAYTTLIHAAGLFLPPFFHEPFGIVILEAWSAVLQVLASNVGGLPHFVEDGADDLFFDPNDGDSLEPVFRRLNDAIVLAQQLAEAGCTKVDSRIRLDYYYTQCC